MNEELQLAVMGYIVATKKQPKSEQEINTIAQQVIQLKQQDPQQYNQLVQLGQQAKQQMAQQQSAGVKAKLGAKLNYINKLKGICPEGTEKVYLAKGGCMCKQKAKEGTKVEEKKTNEIQKFKSARFGNTLDKKKKTSMPTKYDEKKHERLAIGEAEGKNTKAQQDSLRTYRNLFNKQSDQTKYNMGDQKAGYKLDEKAEKKACGSKLKKKK